MGTLTQKTNWDELGTQLRRLGEQAHALSEAKGFWQASADPTRKITEADVADVATKISLLAGEAIELLEAWRMPNPFEHCGKQGCRLNGLEEELADVFIRLCDLAAFFGIDLADVAKQKMSYNATRIPMHGKRF